MNKSEEKSFLDSGSKDLPFDKRKGSYTEGMQIVFFRKFIWSDCFLGEMEKCHLMHPFFVPISMRY